MKLLKYSISTILIILLMTTAIAVISFEDLYAASAKTKITFNKNGGKLSMKSKKVTIGKSYGKLPKPTRTGYSFKGWHTKKKGGKKITAKTKVKQKKSHILYARWKKKASHSAYAKAVLKIVNRERKKTGSGPLQLSVKLTNYSNIRAKEISLKMSHVRPNGLKWNSLNKSLIHAENIAGGLSTPQDVMDGWMDSSGHRVNILNPDYKYMSVSLYKNAELSYEHYWVQMFSRG